VYFHWLNILTDTDWTVNIVQFHWCKRKCMRDKWWWTWQEFQSNQGDHATALDAITRKGTKVLRNWKPEDYFHVDIDHVAKTHIFLWYKLGKDDRYSTSHAEGDKRWERWGVCLLEV